MIAPPPPGSTDIRCRPRGQGIVHRLARGVIRGSSTRARRKAHGGGINGGSFPITDYMYGSLFHFLLVRL